MLGTLFSCKGLGHWANDSGLKVGSFVLVCLGTTPVRLERLAFFQKNSNLTFEMEMTVLSFDNYGLSE